MFSTPVYTPSISSSLYQGNRYQYIHPSLPPIPPSSYIPPIPRSDNEKLREVQLKIEDVKETLHNNIEKVIERGQKIEETETKAFALEQNSNRFYQRAKTLRCMFCKQNVRTIGCIIFILAILIFVIVMIIKSYSN